MPTPRALALLLTLLPAPLLAAPAPAPAALGTPLTWYHGLPAARAAAAEQHKLVLALDVSGDFADPTTTCAAGRRLRRTLNVPALRPLLARFVGAYRTAGPVVCYRRAGVPVVLQGGDVALYVVTPAGRVVHAVAGALDAPQLAGELSWAIRHAAQPKTLAAAHKARARQLSRLRLLKPVAAQPLQTGLLELGVGVDKAIPSRTRAALIHGRLSRQPRQPLERLRSFVWTELLRQVRSDVPVVHLRVLIKELRGTTECRPLDWRPAAAKLLQLPAVKRWRRRLTRRWRCWR